MALADLFTLDMNVGSGFFVVNLDIAKGRDFADLLAITVSLGGIRLPTTCWISC